jgi:hypothetical protein
MGHQQWIGSSGKGLDSLKHVVRGSIYGSCVWSKFSWEGRTNFGKFVERERERDRLWKKEDKYNQ